jgi:hypothetical protein
VSEELEQLDGAWRSLSERIMTVGANITGEGFPQRPRLVRRSPGERVRDVDSMVWAPVT